MSNTQTTTTTRPDLLGNTYAAKPGKKKAIRITVSCNADYELIMTWLDTPEKRGDALVSAASFREDLSKKMQYVSEEDN